MNKKIVIDEELIEDAETVEEVVEKEPEAVETPKEEPKTSTVIVDEVRQI